MCNSACMHAIKGRNDCTIDVRRPDMIAESVKNDIMSEILQQNMAME